jgi:hypothetical protein
VRTPLLAVCLLCANLAQAAAPDATPDVPSPATLRWADRCTDFTSNGWAFKAPRNFLQWLDVFSDPAIWLEFARRGMEPQAYVRTLSSLLDPGTPKNYLEWTDPEIYNNWARAAVEPDFYTAVNAILFDPGRIMRWIMLPTDPRAWNLLATAISPDTWGKWMTAPFHPKTQDLVKKALDAENALKWAQALADPANYPALKRVTIPTATGSQRGNPYQAVSRDPGMKAF